METQHRTIPNEPQEAPVQPTQPEVRQPSDPGQAGIPEEHPVNEPQEIPDEVPQEGDNPTIERAE
jgi:hypothetical protein